MYLAKVEIIIPLISASNHISRYLMASSYIRIGVMFAKINLLLSLLHAFDATFILDIIFRLDTIRLLCQFDLYFSPATNLLSYGKRTN